MPSLILKPLLLTEASTHKLSTASLSLSADLLKIAPAELRFEIRQASGVELIGSAGSSFTYADLKAGLISLKVAAAAEAGLPSFQIQLNAAGVFTSDWLHPPIRYKTVNDAPSFLKAFFSIAPGGWLVLDRSMIFAVDEESGEPGSLLFSARTSHGGFLLNGHASTSFTLADIDAGRVHFRHDGSAAAPAISLSVADAYGKTTRTSFSAALDGNLASAPAPTPALLKISKPLAVTEGGAASLKALLPQLEANLLPGLEFSVDSITHASILLKLDSKTSQAVSRFTYAQLKAGLISLKHDGTEAPAELQLQLLHGDRSLGSCGVPLAFKAVNEAPVLVGHDFAVDPGGIILVHSGLLFASDEEMNRLAGSAAVSFSASTRNGQFLRQGQAVTQFSLGDVEKGLISFRHSGAAGSLASFTLKATDDAGKSSASVKFTSRPAVIDVMAPTLSKNAFVIGKGGILNLSASQLDAGDSDSGTRDAEILFTVTQLSHGRFTRLGDEVRQFSLEDLKLGRMVFSHDGSDQAPAFSFVLSDSSHQNELVPANIRFLDRSLHAVVIETPQSSNLTLGDDDHLVILNALNQADIASGGGDDFLLLDLAADNAGSIDLGEGDDLVAWDGVAAPGRISAGPGADTLELQGPARFSSLLLSQLTGFDEIELTDHAAVIDSLPAGFNGCYFSGSAEASLILAGFSAQGESLTWKEKNYRIWSRDADPSFLIYIQSGITTDDGRPVFSSTSQVDIDENLADGTFIHTAQAQLTLLATSIVYGLGGSDAGAFSIDPEKGEIRLSQSPDFESRSSYQLTVTARAGELISEQSLTVSIRDLNEAPTAISLIETTSSLAENLNVGTGIKIADISIADDALGTETVNLGGADAASFRIVDSELQFIGASPDFENKSSYAVTVIATDLTLSASITSSFALNITNINDAPTGSLSISGSATQGQTLSVVDSLSDQD
ncbi:MAG: hypothetical protein RL095_4163, partial [Verrucomicrobiota bacterium]